MFEFIIYSQHCIILIHLLYLDNEIRSFVYLHFSIALSLSKKEQLLRNETECDTIRTKSVQYIFVKCCNKIVSAKSCRTILRGEGFSD